MKLFPYNERTKFIGILCKMVNHDKTRAMNIKNKLITENLLLDKCGQFEKGL